MGEEESVLRDELVFERRKLKKYCGKMRKRLESEKYREIERIKDQGKMWELLKKIEKRKKQARGGGEMKLKRADGEWVEGEALKEEFRKLFGAMGKGQEEFDEDWEEEMHEDIKQWSQKKGGKGEENMDKEINEEEVRIVVAALKDRKAVGKDGIPAEVFKYGGEAMIKALTELIKHMFMSGRVPKDWMRSIIFPIPKKLGTQEVKNYRGISLIPVVMKVYGLVL